MDFERGDELILFLKMFGAVGIVLGILWLFGILHDGKWKHGKGMFFLVLLILPAIAFGQVHPYLGLSVGRGGDNQATYSSFMGGIVAGIEINHIGPEIEILQMSQATKYGENGIKEGSLTLNPIMLNLKVSPALPGKFRVTGKAGISYVMANRELSSRELWFYSYPNYKVSEEAKDGFGFQFGGGIERKVNKHTAISLEVTQMIFKSEFVFKKKDLNNLDDQTRIEKTEVDLSQILGQILIRYCW